MSPLRLGVAAVAMVLLATSCASTQPFAPGERVVLRAAQAKVPGLAVGVLSEPDEAEDIPGPGLTVWEHTSFAYHPTRTFRWNGAYLELWVTWHMDDRRRAWTLPVASCSGLEADLEALAATIAPSVPANHAAHQDLGIVSHALPWYDATWVTDVETIAVSQVYTDDVPLWAPVQQVQSRLQGCLGALWPDPVPQR